MKFHFIAIGGSVMHNLAIALHAKGDIITGSDDEIFEPAKGRLNKVGLLPVSEGWFPERITKDLDGIVLGMHAKVDNPELIKARDLNIPIYSFPEFLYQNAKNKKRIVIGGSHGKTTITVMIMHVLKSLDMDFDYMVGAQLKGFNVMVRISDDAPVMIFEGDEYLTSALDKRPKFHLYKPHLAVISGIEWDHMNVFPTKEIYIEQFAKFITLIENNGTLVYCEDDRLVKELVSKSSKKLTKIPYSLLDYQMKEGSCTVIYKGKGYDIHVFGKHNLLNLNAARVVCNQMGIEDEIFFECIQSYEGAAKRLELLAENESISVFTDFAHAPSKLKATVEAVKSRNPDRELIAIMELHTYSSLSKEFLPEYNGSMDSADKAVVFYNLHSFEIKRLPFLNKEDVKKGFGRKDLVIFNTRDELQEYLQGFNWKNKNLLFMSSGDFGSLNIISLSKEIIK